MELSFGLYRQRAKKVFQKCFAENGGMENALLKRREWLEPQSLLCRNSNSKLRRPEKIVHFFFYNLLQDKK